MTKYKTCNTCEHYSRPNPVTTTCAHIELARRTIGYTPSSEAERWAAGQDRLTGSVDDAVDDCPMHALASELVVQEYRTENGQCKYCAWPAGRCHHENG